MFLRLERHHPWVFIAGVIDQNKIWRVFTQPFGDFRLQKERFVTHEPDAQTDAALSEP